METTNHPTGKPDIEAFLEQQKTELLFRNVGLAQSVNVFNATLLAYANVDMHMSAIVAFVWWCLFAATAAARYRMAIRFHAARPDAMEAPTWRHRYLAGTVAGATMWSIGIVLFMWKAPDGALLLTGLVVSGTIAGAIPVLAPVPVVFRTFTLMVGIPMTASVLLQANSPLYWAYGVMTIAFIAALIKSGNYLHETLDVAIRLGLEQSKLIGNLEQARNAAVAALDESKRTEIALHASEARFRLLASATFEGIAVTEQGRFVDANEQLLAMLGYDRAELIGMAVLDVLPVDDQQRVIDNIQRGVESNLEHRMIRKEGRLIDVEAHGQNIDSEGRALRITALRDISERKLMSTEREQLIARLESEQDFLNVLTDSFPGTFYAVDTEGHFVRWNRKFETETGLSAEEIRTLNPIDLFVGDNRALIAERMAKVFAEGYTSVEADVRIWDGSFRPYLLTGQRATLNGQVLMIGVGLDVSSIKTMEAELIRHRDHLEELVQERTTALAQAKASAEASLSLVEATLEATDNGILVVSREGEITSSNKRFASMWQIPQELVSAGNDDAVLHYAINQLVDPQQFYDGVQALYNNPEAASRDTLHFSDGRVFARFSHPQRIRNEIIGRVWSFLDITEQARAEQRVLQLFPRPSPRNWNTPRTSADN
jgi:PAS domain S-box-containing protein